MMEAITDNPRIQKLQHALQEGENVLMEELWDSPKAYILSLAQKITGKHILVLTAEGQEENRLYHDLQHFSNRPIVDFPAWETLPNENLPPSPDVVGDRYQILNAITKEEQPHIVISNLQACLQKVIPQEHFEMLYLKVKTGETIPFNDLIGQLEVMGYTRTPVASDKGEFAVRGGIIDVFPVSTPDPYRIEFWGDEIESIRLYDPIGQKTVQQASEVSITPAQELELIAESGELQTILDYLGPNTLVVFDNLLALEDRYANLTSICGKPTRTFAGLDQLLDAVTHKQILYWTSEPIEELAEVTMQETLSGNYYSDTTPVHRISFEMFNRSLQALRWRDPFIPIAPYLVPDNAEATGEEVLRALGKFGNSDYKVVMLCETEQEQTHLRKQMLDLQISLPQQTDFALGYLSSGFALEESKLIVFPMTEVTHRYRIRRQKQRSTYHTVPSESFEIITGDMVVHLHNGIGKYLGIETRPDHTGIETEFMKIEYANNAQLFVPLNQSHLVNKYIGSNDTLPKINEIGSKKWKRVREQTEKSIIGYASDLLKVYAEREVKGGFSFPDDSPDMVSFEEEFPFIETEDQLAAIQNLKSDMLSDQAMERLICGDVGYGKTEVAMRAAFKTVVDGGKQVAILVPTTILAMQHYDTFIERMRNFPINIAALSRFRTAKQIRETLEGVANGTIDILIGTHRIVSKDVEFKNLGLVIIDEEQRFGVRAKEHLKKIKSDVDCLTLTATPIPRTLYMSLIGVRDMSVISTPPQDRLPITTLITESTDDVFKSALLRELARDGQAFVIHNRVETIYGVADRIKKLLPKARVLVGHGQMHADELDIVFHAFKNGEADILVATTIVENGVDIPNANTILIDRADQYGLAALYQLRGRVGRWNRRAYAYFMVPNRRVLPEIARKRLQALVEASGYGGGMKLAMRDLEIRGAGDLLGTEQSGHVSQIGFHFYCKLLKRTILALQGKISTTITDTKMEFPIDARLPEDYVNETSLRMDIYQRLGDAINWDQVSEIWNELKDRFGPPPESVLWLYHLTRIRVYASNQGFISVKWAKYSLVTEQKRGKKVLGNTSLIGNVSTPQEMESKVLQALKKA